jgi:methionyl aminopeptidase
VSQSQIFTKAEIDALRRSGKILHDCLIFLRGRVSAGVTTGSLDGLAEEFIRSHDGAPAFKGYRGYQHTLCTSVNEEVVHGIPGKRKLKEGDIISLDCGVTVDGLITDACITVPVGRVSKDAAHLLSVTERALGEALRVVRGGCHVGDISAAVQSVVEREGLQCVRSLTGHGVGYTVHQFPDIPNVGEAGTGPLLPAGTAVAVEPIVTTGKSDRIATADDDWTISMADSALSAHFEHTVLVTEDGCEVMT